MTERLYMGAIFEGLSPRDLHAHLAYLAAEQANLSRAEIFLGAAQIGIPLIRRVHKRKPDEIGLLIRSDSVGREAMDRIVGSLASASYELRLHKSSKLRVVSQCVVLWPVHEASLSLHVVSVLEIIAKEVGAAWPPRLSLQYSHDSVEESLPGRLRVDPYYRAGRAIGRIAGKFFRRLKPGRD